MLPGDWGLWTNPGTPINQVIDFLILTHVMSNHPTMSNPLQGVPDDPRRSIFVSRIFEVQAVYHRGCRPSTVLLWQLHQLQAGNANVFRPDHQIKGTTSSTLRTKYHKCLFWIIIFFLEGIHHLNVCFCFLILSPISGVIRPYSPLECQYESPSWYG